MLILMRKPGESIDIGLEIVVTLVSLDRNRARIGIQAPRRVAVDRTEVADRKRRDGILPPRGTLETPIDTSADAEPEPEEMTIMEIVLTEAAAQATPLPKGSAFTPPKPYKSRQKPRRKK